MPNSSPSTPSHPSQPPTSSNTKPDLKALLESTQRIAVVGLSDKPYRASFGVSQYMQARGYHIYPVNPGITEVLNTKAYDSLADLPVQVDMVNVFRRSEEVPQIVEQAIAHGAKSLWLQLGVMHAEAEARAEAAGLIVVRNRCLKVVHAQLLR